MPKKSKEPKAVLIGMFEPDGDDCTIFSFSGPPCDHLGAVVVHGLQGFNSEYVKGVIEITSAEDRHFKLADILEEDGGAPTSMNAAGARKLAELLLKAAEVSEAMNNDR
jgi:hypothetical protein